ncbi:MAG: hypothetical protein COB05_05380 [Marinobacter sp.]|nr:MAG: hypothetical protein COB05_05380 [Marinobacter sp.]
MLIAGYEQWKAEKRQMLEQENPEVDCEECGGLGETYERCHCCGSEKEQECEICDGRGSIRYLDSSKPRPGADLVGRRVYFQEVIADLKKWCAYTRQDFLSTAAPFVSSFRRGEVE